MNLTQYAPLQGEPKCLGTLHEIGKQKIEKNAKFQAKFKL
jgi:hypothetical protein